MLDYGARFYDPEIGRFNVVDRYAEKYDAVSSYQYGGLNPILYVDVHGDSLMLFKNGKYISTVDNGKTEITGFNQQSQIDKNGREKFTGSDSFSFNDIELDKSDLMSGKMTLNFLSKNDVSSIIKNSGVEEQSVSSRWSYASVQSNQLNERGTGRMDYLSQVQQGKLTIINGIGYNPNDAGNYLWGYGMGTMGFTSVMSRVAAHLNAWWSAKTSNPGMASTNSNPVLRWFENRSWTGDATADQRAIQNGLNDSGTYMKSKKRTFENLWK